VREHTAGMRPPRFLWVPFELGRPFGAPGDPAFQSKVLRSVLALLERTDGPVILEDFPEDAPAPTLEEMAGWVCPINLPKPAAAAEPAILADVLEEIGRLAPWYEFGREARGGRTTVGVSGLGIEEMARFLHGFFDGLPGRIFAVAYSPDGKHLACGSSLDRQGYVYIYSADYDSSIPKEIEAIESKVGRSAEERATLEKHYTSDVKLLAKAEGQGGPVYGLAYSPDGKTIVSSGFDGRVRLNDAETGALIKEFDPVPIQNQTAQIDQ